MPVHQRTGGATVLTRIKLFSKNKLQVSADNLYSDFAKRLESAPLGTCPVELASAFTKLCLAQSCGKCVPCRIGLKATGDIIDKILEGNGTYADLELLEKTVNVIAESSDCAIGSEAAGMVLTAIKGFREDFISHIEKDRCHQEFVSVPCVAGCPANVDIPGYIALTLEGRYADAIRLIRKDNPFPWVCGLICEHPCEVNCRRGIVDSAINIRGIKNYACEMAGMTEPPEKNPPTGKQVAIIGGGPSGLTCAYYLALMGHSVTIYEQREKLGGMLRYGIPIYRLPDKQLDEDINIILSLGIKVKTGVKIGKDIIFEDIKKNFAAVYVTIGAHSDKRLNIEGEDSKGVYSAVEFLRNMGEGNLYNLAGKKVVIVGGGNVAMDATRTAIRLGAQSVTCVYRRRIEDMTALKEEIEGAVAEGCEINQLMAPVRIESDSDGNVIALITQPQVIGNFDRGRPKPYKADKHEAKIPCDIIIIAIGQDIESAHFKESGMDTKWNTFITDASCSVKNIDGVFAGGDCVSGPSTVIKAIEAGKVASANIDNYLGFSSILNVDVEIPAPKGGLMPPCGRITMQERNAGERKNDFDIMEKPMSLEEVKQECRRCLRCDHYGYGSFRGGRREQW